MRRPPRPPQLGHRPPLVIDGPPSVSRQLTAEELRRAGYTAIFDSFPHGSITIFDADLRYVLAGGMGLAEVGLTREALVGHTIWEAFPAETAVVLEPLFRGALAGREASFDVPYLDRVYHARVSPLEAASGPVMAGIVFATDVTEERQREARLIESEERFRVAFDNAPISMSLVSLDGHFLQVNDAMCQMTGYDADALLGMNFTQLTHPDDLGAELEQLALLLAGEADGYLTETRVVKRGGLVGWALLARSLVRGADGRPLHFVAQAQDITERKRQLDDLERLASSDELTGVLNRRRFNEELDRYERLFSRYGEEGAVVVVDLDGLKAVNDALGHHAGDMYISQAASAICSRVRATDIVARLGGDEFGILLPHVDLAHAGEIAAALAKDIARCAAGGTASVGVAMIAGTDAASALDQADAAMYDAKRAGGNRVVVAVDQSCG